MMFTEDQITRIGPYRVEGTPEGLLIRGPRELLAGVRDGIEEVLRPAPGLRRTLTYVEGHGVVTARELADALLLSIANASSKLARLHEGGYLQRESRVAETGGKEYVYTRREE